MGLCVRTGVFADSSLKPARFPVLIQTVNGEFCKGGSKGLDLTLTMSVQDGDRTKKVRLEPYWCYEAGIKEVDLIIGYPYLKVFALMVDPDKDCLRVSPGGRLRAIKGSCLRKELDPGHHLISSPGHLEYVPGPCSTQPTSSPLVWTPVPIPELQGGMGERRSSVPTSTHTVATIAPSGSAQLQGLLARSDAVATYPSGRTPGDRLSERQNCQQESIVTYPDRLERYSNSLKYMEQYGCRIPLWRPSSQGRVDAGSVTAIDAAALLRALSLRDSKSSHATVGVITEDLQATGPVCEGSVNGADTVCEGIGTGQHPEGTCQGNQP